MMNHEQVLAVLYDLAAVMGGEVNLQPLLTKTLQRLLYHTSFPCGMIFLASREKGTGIENISASLDLAIGDYELAAHIGRSITVPTALLNGEAAIIENMTLFEDIPCRKDYYSVSLRLPINGCGVILLLSRSLPETDLPLTRLFQPVMSNFAKAVLLCRNNEAYTSMILSERNQARLEFERLSHRNKLILDSVGEGIYGVDMEGKTTFVNPAAAKLLGYGPGELLGRPSHEAIHHSRPDKTPYPAEDCPIYMSFKTGNLHRVAEDLFWKKDGTSFPVEYVSAPIMEDERIVGAVVVFMDITDSKRAEESLHKVNVALKTLSSCNMTLIHAANEADLLKDICRTIVEVGGYRMAWVGIPEQDPAIKVRPVTYSGTDPGYLETLSVTLSQCGVGEAISTGKPCIIRDITTEPACISCRDEAVKMGYLSFISLPMKADEQFIGVLNIYASEIDAFNEEEVRLLEELAADLAFGVVTLRTRDERNQAIRERQQYLDSLRESLEDTVQAIAATIEMRDPYTAGHQRRVADLAAAIAREMGLPDERVRALHIAGSIHDLGKIYVPAEILSKPRRLNDAEFGLIKLHPQAGYDILKEVKFPWPVAQIVYQHHEKLDGSGYPNGLRGSDILLEARILTVADEVEAMSSHRPYRPALGLNTGLDEIKRNRGAYYDPEVVDACVRLFEEKGYSLE